VAQPPVAQPANPAAPAAKPPVAQPANPAAPMAKPPVATPVTAPKAAPVDKAGAAVDKLKASVDGLLKVAETGSGPADAKAKADMVVTDLGAVLLALVNGSGQQKAPTA
ncbi:hypothetical protein AB0N28_16570, partial [Streptomyces sp. NPDC051130]|uniref:hypothetical protein n=1 Tax=Streptomyces sp. NPDC051130 TaxID=3157223 RepID=UPI003433DDC5